MSWRMYMDQFILIAGGCAAQEVIKIITKQYKPIDNTFIYNAISTESVTLKL